ncbi:MAG: hemK [Clostridiaceae bacterium]|jgi:release factor glutamine methyltransferase|nr:hemK [Clostridiaceae bacterium]
MDNSIQDLLTQSYNLLKSANIESYILDAQLLMAKAINKDKLFVITNRDYIVDIKQRQHFWEFINMRIKHMPVKYIIGECEFMGLNFIITPGVLIPRPDTETLVEAVLDDIKKTKAMNVCDVCCGSGAIGISIANYAPEVIVNCYDISDTACRITRSNITKFSLDSRVFVEKSDILSLPVSDNKKFQIIVSNPPYIKAEDIDKLMSDVKDYEPYEALYGGEDGVDFYRKITRQSLKLLESDGILAFEIGDNQKNEVMDIMKSNGFSDVYCIKDLSGRDRVIKGIMKS